MPTEELPLGQFDPANLPPGSPLEGIRFSQLDLATICSEDNERSRELRALNNAYGIPTLLRRYASLPENELLTFSFEHGISLEDEKIWDGYLTHGLPVFMATTPERVKVFQGNSDMDVAPGGFAIHYARRLLEEQEKWKDPGRRAGTLAFPHKSVGKVDRSFDFESFADWLAGLPEVYQPVCVCIYWKDYLKGKHQAYLDRGMPVVSCGHYHDAAFLFRLIDLCSRFEYSCSNAIAGGAIFSVLSGCHFFFKDAGTVVESASHFGERINTNPGGRLTHGAEFQRLAPFPPESGLLEMQRELVNRLTGTKCVLPPKKIRDLQESGRRKLLKRQPRQMSFVEVVDSDALHCWLAWNIRNDGRTRLEPRFWVKGRASKCGLRVFFKLSPAVFEERETLKLTVRFGGNGRLEFDLAPGRYELVLSLPRLRDCPVGLELSPNPILKEKNNYFTALRFLGWEVVDRAPKEAMCEPISRRRLPEFVAVPEGW